MRFVTVLLFAGLSAGLAMVSGLALWSPTANWDLGRLQRNDGTPAGVEKAAALFGKALETDAASPYAWADLAEAYDEIGRFNEAGNLFERATQLGPSSPPVLLRAGFHWLKADDHQRALRCTSRVLEISDQYDQSVFSIYQRFHVPLTSVVTAGLGVPNRAWQAYLKWLISQDRGAAADTVWNLLGEKAGHDAVITKAYLEYLIRKKQYGRVPAIWERFAGKRADGYGRGAVVFDGSFEGPLTGSPVDWNIEPESQGVMTAREQGIAKDGDWSLAVRFGGKANIAWAGVNQLVVMHAGRYHLRAWLKADGVTTDRGPQFQVQDVDNPARLTVRSEPVRGTQQWARIDLPFQLDAGTAAVVVSLMREPSRKFDNKVAGTIWVDGVEIVSDTNSMASAR